MKKSTKVELRNLNALIQKALPTDQKELGVALSRWISKAWEENERVFIPPTSSKSMDEEEIERRVAIQKKEIEGIFLEEVIAARANYDALVMAKVKELENLQRDTQNKFDEVGHLLFDLLGEKHKIISRAKSIHLITVGKFTESQISMFLINALQQVLLTKESIVLFDDGGAIVDYKEEKLEVVLFDSTQWQVFIHPYKLNFTKQYAKLEKKKIGFKELAKAAESAKDD